MGLFDLFRKKKPEPEKPTCGEYSDNWPPELKMVQAMQHFRILNDSIELISKTVYPKTFFYRYGLAVQEAQVVVNLSKGLENEQAVQDILRTLQQEKTNIINSFLFRCYDSGKLPSVKDDIKAYRSEMPRESFELFSAMIEYQDLLSDDHRDLDRTRLLGSAAIAALFVAGAVIGGVSSNHDHSRYCNGDCANCPPHYGYRYGRWYYGHGHQSGCERGGNGGASGKTYRD